MSTLREFMGVAIESDATRFSGDGYADERWGAVRGTVRRRRAVRTAGVSSASVMGAGALVFGAAAVPWNQFSPLTFVGSATCEPTGPALAQVPVDVPDGARVAVVDDATGAAFFVGFVDGEGAAWNIDGSLVDLTSVSERVWTLTLPSGEVVTLEADAQETGFSVAPAEGAPVSLVGPYEYAALVAVGEEGTATDGLLTVLERADLDPTISQDGAESLTVFVVNKTLAGGEQETVTLRLADGALFQESGDGQLTELRELDGTYIVVFPSGATARLSLATLEGHTSGAIQVEAVAVSQTDSSGETIVVTIEGEGGVEASPDAVAEPSHGPEAVADDDCVAPSPSESPVPSASASASAEPSPAAEPTVSDEPTLAPTGPAWWDKKPGLPAAASPFQCDFEFPATVGSTGVITVGEPTWLSPAEADEAVAEPFAYLSPDTPRFSGADVPVVPFGSDEGWASANIRGGAANSHDPALLDHPAADQEPGDLTSGDGAQFLLAVDGKVAATLAARQESTLSTPQWVDFTGAGSGILYGFDTTTDLTACPGVDAGDLEDADLVAVAGTVLFADDAVADGPYYAWRFIERP